MNRIKRAIISVSDKTGIVEFAQGLAKAGVEILSTGGTARALREAGLDVLDVSDFTGSAEILDGRVKTLHPKVHAGLLFVRDNAEHQETMNRNDLVPIDLVCVNLYPFEQTVARDGVTFEEAIENIDIGGPTMLRSAAKNMKYVTVVTDPSDYDRVLTSMEENAGDTTEALRIELGYKVFARVAAYNAAITNYLAKEISAKDDRAAPLCVAYASGETLRYGENPHQSAALYLDAEATEACIAHTEVLHGKAMSYNNYVDGEGALEAVKELHETPGISIIKHTNPCGYATGETLAEALEAAWQGDPVSAFGSVIASTRPIDRATAEALKGRFVEALIAPDFEDDALEYLRKKSKDLRLLKLKHPMGPAGKGLAIKQINGGLLAQDRDIELLADWSTATKTPFPEDKKELALFGMRACKHVKSNAIVLVREYKSGSYHVLGMGAGQPNRVDAVRKLAVTKARENIAEWAKESETSPEEFEKKIMGEAVLISDAFFPFPDNIYNAAEAGIRYIVEPGGSKRDDEVVAACDEKGIAMAFTGMRHFKH